MTKEQSDRLNEAFTRYGSPADECNTTLYLYFRRPDSLSDPGEIISEDKRVADRIGELERYVELMKLDRLALSEQYNKLCCSPSFPVVRLKRQRDSYTNKVFYYLSTFRRFEDGKETRHETKKFSGTERSAAIAEYKAYVKNHPGIIAEMDIAKINFEK